MKKLVLVYNPVSGHAAMPKRLDPLIAAIQERGMIVVPYRTQKGENAGFGAFIRSVEPDGIIAAGGDGTLHIVINLMMKHDIHLPLGIIGSGTSNDFATYLGITGDLGGYLDTIAAGRTRAVDLGLVDSKYFVNVASAGCMTGIAHEVDARFKNRLGKLAYYIKGVSELPKFRPLPFHIRADGDAFDVSAYFFVVVNSAVVGSMRHISDTIKVDDGLLDLLAVQSTNARELIAISRNLFTGQPVDHFSSILHLQAEAFHISSTVPMQGDLDGEAGPDLPMKIETIPQAIRIYC